VSRTYSHRPDALAAWIGLKDAVTSTMDRRRYELVTIAAARRVRSSYCMLAHGNVLADKFYDAGRVREIALDHHAAGLDEVDVVTRPIASWTRAFARRSSSAARSREPRPRTPRVGAASLGNVDRHERRQALITPLESPAETSRRVGAKSTTR
jgi:hypothetical protein